MHHTTTEETVVNRAANEELFNDLMHLGATLENIQNLNPPGKINAFSHYYSLYFNHWSIINRYIINSAMIGAYTIYWR